MTLSVAMLQSCFTGIESTPKITAGDVRREKITSRPEESYLSDILPQPLDSWQPGKRFYVADNKFSILFGKSSPEAQNLQGQTLLFHHADEVTSITGDKVVQLSFTTPAGRIITYDTGQSRASIDRAMQVEVPFTVDMDLVDSVATRIKGQQYYVITPSWYDTALQSRTGRKFVPVTVTDVLPGTAFYPILLKILDENGQPFCLLMSVGHDMKAPRKFASLFSLSDPRLRYPTITDANWRNIILGRVAEDMTRDECRLALGSPATVDRRPGYSIMSEIWTYENGIYLIFEDGILRSFRQ